MDRHKNALIIGTLGTGRGYNGSWDTQEYVFSVVTIDNNKRVHRTTRNLLQFNTGKPYSKRIVKREWANRNSEIH